MGACLAASGVAVAARSRPSETCEGGAQLLAGTWDASVAKAVHAAFVRTGWLGADDAFARIRGPLDEQAARWAESYRDACRATHVLGTQPATVLAGRMRCLERRRTELRATTELLTHADRELATRAANLVGSLGDLEACSATLADTRALPIDKDARQRFEAAEAAIDRAAILRRAAHLPEARTVLEGVVEAGRALGQPALLAEALAPLGEVQAIDGDSKAAHASFDEAIRAAGQASDARLFAEALLGQSKALTAGFARPAEALALQPIVEGAVAAAGNPARLSIRRLGDLAHTLDELGRHEDALVESQKAVALAETTFGADAWETAQQRMALSAIERLAGRREDARCHGAEALASFERLLGPDHPELYDPLLVAASAESGGGDLHVAERHIRRAIVLLEAALPGHSRLMHAYRRLGSSLFLQGRSAEAEVALRRARDLASSTSPPDLMMLADINSWLADVVREQRGITAAREFFERTRHYYRAGGRTEDPFFGETLVLWASAECGSGNLALATELLEEARPVLAPRKDFWRAKLLVGEAECGIRAQHGVTARAQAEEAIAMLAPIGKHDDLADARFALARAHWSLGDRRRAFDEAQRAANELEDTGRARQEEILAWMRERGGAPSKR